MNEESSTTPRSINEKEDCVNYFFECTELPPELESVLKAEEALIEHLAKAFEKI
jgi:hypothetical protein